MGGGANIHIFVFTYLENSGFQKKLITQNANISILAPPPPVIDLALSLILVFNETLPVYVVGKVPVLKLAKFGMFSYQRLLSEISHLYLDVVYQI